MKRWRVIGPGSLAVLLAVAAACWWWSDSRLEHSQDGVILAAATRYGVDPSLIKALVWQESRFNPRARGKDGEVGLMQLLDPAAQEWAETVGVYPISEVHLYHPATNVMAGTWYLRKMLWRYRSADDPLPYALADYNAGRANVLKWAQGPASTNSCAFLAQIRFPGTHDYVLSVTARREQYRRDFPSVPTRKN